jgi:hypothetical protein
LFRLRVIRRLRDIDLLLQTFELVAVGAEQCFEETHAILGHAF